MPYRIRPFKDNGLWVFTDERVGLEKEPLVEGIDTMLDVITQGIPNAADGFELIFCDSEFQGWAYSLEWRRPNIVGGDWYYCPQLDAEGWLCPALGRYFKEPPKQLFICAR